MIWQAIDAKTKIVGIHRHRLERFVHPFLHLSRFCAIRHAQLDAAAVYLTNLFETVPQSYMTPAIDNIG